MMIMMCYVIRSYNVRFQHWVLQALVKLTWISGKNPPRCCYSWQSWNRFASLSLLWGSRLHLEKLCIFAPRRANVFLISTFKLLTTLFFPRWNRASGASLGSAPAVSQQLAYFGFIGCHSCFGCHSSSTQCSYPCLPICEAPGMEAIVSPKHLCRSGTTTWCRCGSCLEWADWKTRWTHWDGDSHGSYGSLEWKPGIWISQLDANWCSSQ